MAVNYMSILLKSYTTRYNLKTIRVETILWIVISVKLLFGSMDGEVLELIGGLIIITSMIDLIFIFRVSAIYGNSIKVVVFIGLGCHTIDTPLYLLQTVAFSMSLALHNCGVFRGDEADSLVYSDIQEMSFL
ncbi:hypothetical protein BDQ17DRAFT_1339187 [Cyathus striatus]|nr:hypothetical protein BDQ17DRAFT_1339187 [Cyathus striatus]